MENQPIHTHILVALSDGGVDVTRRHENGDFERPQGLWPIQFGDESAHRPLRGWCPGPSRRRTSLRSGERHAVARQATCRRHGSALPPLTGADTTGCR